MSLFKRRGITYALAPAAQAEFVRQVELDRQTRLAELGRPAPIAGELLTDPAELFVMPPGTILVGYTGALWSRTGDQFHFPWSTLGIARFYTTAELVERIELPAEVLR